MFYKLSARNSLVLVALLAVIGMMYCFVRCGQLNDSPTDGIISGGEEVSGKIPEITLIKRVWTTKAGGTEVCYHFEDLEGAPVILQKDTGMSEAFSFGDHLSQVIILQHKGLLDFKQE